MSISRAKTLTEKAASNVMREIARIAEAHGIKQERLAKMLGTSPANVGRHFMSLSPRSGTIDDYRTRLGISKAHLRLIEGKVTKADRLAARDSVRSDVVYYELLDGAGMVAFERFIKSEAAHLALDSYAICRHRRLHGIDPNDIPLTRAFPNLPDDLRTFARDARSEGFDFAHYTQSHDDSVSYVHDVVAAVSDLASGNPESARAMVDGILRVLRQAQPMAAARARKHLSRCHDCRHILAIAQVDPIKSLLEAERNAAQAAERDESE